MSTDLSIGRQGSINRTTQQFDYGNWGPFSSQAISIFSHVFSFLESESLNRTDLVCRNWRLCNSSILGEAVWRRYIGEVGPVPQIPKAISPLKNWDKADPCKPSATIGKEYVWVYCPDQITIKTRRLAFIQSEDSPTKPPRLMQKIELEQVSVTLNNLEGLFEHIKRKHAPKYGWVWHLIAEQEGMKRIPAQWVCMRRDVIGRNLSFEKQEALAEENGVKIPRLLHRIIFNLLEYVRSGTYPDGVRPCTFARTSTFIFHTGEDRPVGCGRGDSFGLNVYNGLCFGAIDSEEAGVSVALK